mmetsp:Transcript_22350/g.51823  ORF Transcript_22350/g.51823 Transcript_22350/m.51823 type:complete len:302 (-) Transcript_22350:248-1153(-)
MTLFLRPPAPLLLLYLLLQEHCMPPSGVCLRRGAIMTQGIRHEHGILEHLHLLLTLLCHSRKLHLGLFHLVLQSPPHVLIIKSSRHVVPGLGKEERVPGHMSSTFIHKLHVFFCNAHIEARGCGRHPHGHRGIGLDGIEKDIVSSGVLDEGIVSWRLLFPLPSKEALHLLAENRRLRSAALGDSLPFDKGEEGDRLSLVARGLHCGPLGLLLGDRGFVLLRELTLHRPLGLVGGLDALALHAILLDQLLDQLTGILPRQGLLLLLLYNELLVVFQQLTGRHRQSSVPASFRRPGQQPCLHL